MTVDVLPDVPKLARAWMLSQSAMTSLVGQRVTTRSPSTPIFPYVTLQRVGGTAAIRERLDAARIQVDAWGNTEGEASSVARTARAVLQRMEGYTTDLAVCTYVVDDLGLSWLPDTERTPPTPRFVFGVIVYAHALP